MQVIADGTRFAFAGAANTLATLLLYQVFVSFMSPLTSYIIVWIIGITFMLLLFPSFVYKGSRLTFKNASLTVALYLFSLAVGSASIVALNNYGMPKRVSIVFVIIITAAINFAGSRFLFRKTTTNTIST